MSPEQKVRFPVLYSFSDIVIIYASNRKFICHVIDCWLSEISNSLSSAKEPTTFARSSFSPPKTSNTPMSQRTAFLESKNIFLRKVFETPVANGIIDGLPLETELVREMGLEYLTYSPLALDIRFTAWNRLGASTRWPRTQFLTIAVASHRRRRGISDCGIGMACIAGLSA